MAKSLQKRHENHCKCIETPRNRGFFGDGSHHHRTEEEESFAASGVKARNGKRSPRCSFVVIFLFQLTAFHHIYHFIYQQPSISSISMVQQHLVPAVRSSAQSWLPRTPLRMCQTRTTTSAYLVLFIRVLYFS